jgi:hypothetical protein
MNDKTQIKKSGWLYQCLKESDKLKLEISPDPKLNITKPKTLHKYFGLSEQGLRNALNNKLFAPHPILFNDLFDCHEDLIIFDDLDVIGRFIYGDKISEWNDLINSKNFSIDDFTRFTARNSHEIFYRTIGILCLTNNPLNPIMWGYYTNHRGVAFEFDFSKFPFLYHGPFPVNYQKKVEPISISEAGVACSFLYQTNIKHEGWSKEEEWRFLVESPQGQQMESYYFEEFTKLGGHDRLFPFPIDSVVSLKLGNRFFLPNELKAKKDDTIPLEIKPQDPRYDVLNYIINNNKEAFLIVRAMDLTTCDLQKVGFEKTGENKFLMKPLN